MTRSIRVWASLLLLATVASAQGVEFDVEWPAGGAGVWHPLEVDLPASHADASLWIVELRKEETLPLRTSFQRIPGEGRRFLVLLPAREGKTRYRILKSGKSGGGRGVRHTKLDLSVEGRLRLLRGDSALLAYVSGMKLPEGQKADRRRSTYVYPVRDLSGVNVLDDFPKDHPHHRGISWMWPQVTIGKKTHDLWHIRGIRQRFESQVGHIEGSLRSGFTVQNGWYEGGERVLSERVKVHATPAIVDEKLVGHLLDFHFRWEATKEPVILGGQKEGGKGYGGFGLRLAPRKEARITTSHGVVPKDSLHQRPSWADYSAKFRGAEKVSGIAILPHPGNEGSPSEWILRRYGYIGECWPGLRGLTLQKGKPVEARYRVIVHLGSADAARIASFQKLWATPPQVRRDGGR